ncbi:MAG TPA: N-acetylmuramoyl-L-alanine amidase, partial [Chitinophagales bacterium]|nr:N-acetylmuramoyl-L-alanine amidase [Chitinophagales bacterium]
YQNAHLSQSIQLASLVEKQFKLRANRHSRGVKQESFLVLYQTAMPSILIESGFLSNSEEERYLLSDNGQSLIASAVYRAFKSYKQQLENAAGTPSKTTRHN